MKLYIKTNGCQMNDYDSSRMADLLETSHQMKRVTTPDEADVLLLNTCSVREKAQEKVFSELGRWRSLKENRPEVLIGVGGCVASQEGKAILRRAPFVDLVFGPQTLHRLPEMIDQVLKNRKPALDVSFPEIEKFDCLPEPKADGVTAFVSIMEGCNKYCTYCIVPYTRGQEISRPFDDVIAEVVSLAEQGVKEVTLLGQNVNDYLGQMHDGKIATLAKLLDYVSVIDGIERIRFTTSHPLAFSDELIDAYANIPKLADHLHLPVQSGSDRILALMKRDYTAADFIKKIEKLRKVRPNISVTSDFIVGFPGETDEDFKATMNLIHEIGFDHSFSFIYSPRPGTPAAKLSDNVSMDAKKERLKILQTRIDQHAIMISQSMVDTTQPILVVGQAKKHQDQISGRTENNRVVNFLGELSLVGQIVDVRVTEALPNSLRGEIVFAKASPD